MAESTPLPPASTFVVRFWQEWSATEGPRWRGRIEHVQSGESATFLNLDEMLDFVRRFGAMADDGGRPAEPSALKHQVAPGASRANTCTQKGSLPSDGE